MSDKDLTIEKAEATLERVQEFNRRLRDELLALLPFADATPDGAVVARQARGVLYPLDTEKRASRMETLTAERDAAIAERDELQKAVDAAMVEHSTLEAERARLAREVEQLKAQNANGSAEYEQLRKRAVASYAEAESLRAQLAFLAAEHESAAQVAEKRIGRLAEALGRLESAGELDCLASVPCGQCDHCLAKAVLAEVSP